MTKMSIGVIQANSNSYNAVHTFWFEPSVRTNSHTNTQNPSKILFFLKDLLIHIFSFRYELLLKHGQ